MSQSWQAQGISNKSKLMSFWSESNVKISSMLVCIWMCRCRRRAAAYLIPRHFYTIANFSAMRYYFCSWTVFVVAVVDVVAVFFSHFFKYSQNPQFVCRAALFRSTFTSCISKCQFVLFMIIHLNIALWPNVLYCCSHLFTLIWNAHVFFCNSLIRSLIDLRLT